jgi:hypothetical protein
MITYEEPLVNARCSLQQLAYCYIVHAHVCVVGILSVAIYNQSHLETLHVDTS